MKRTDPRRAGIDLTKTPPLPDWKALGVPVLELGDFFPELISRSKWMTPAYTFSRRVRRKLHAQLFKSAGIVAKVCDYKMYLPLQIKGIGNSLAAWGFRELDQHYLITQVLTPNLNVLDIGANIGYYVAMHGKLMNYTGHVYAVEPDSRSVEFLRMNIALNRMDQMVTVDQIALSDCEAVMDFHLAEHPNLSSLNISNLSRKYAGCRKVSVMDFVEYLEGLDHAIDVMRMDIEGEEMRIFKSLTRKAFATGDTTRAPRSIIFEGHAWEYVNRSGRNEMRSAIEDMFKIGYRARFLSTCIERHSPIRRLGYTPKVVIPSGHNYYGIYEDINNEHAVDLISSEPSLTGICLQRNEP